MKNILLVPVASILFGCCLFPVADGGFFLEGRIGLEKSIDCYASLYLENERQVDTRQINPSKDGYFKMLWLVSPYSQEYKLKVKCADEEIKSILFAYPRDLDEKNRLDLGIIN